MKKHKIVIGRVLDMTSKNSSSEMVEDDVLEEDKDDFIDLQIHNCLYCEYSAKNRGNLKKHILHNHSEKSGKKLEKCDKCDFVAVTKHGLTMHNARHMRGTLQKCNGCIFETDIQFEMQRHRKLCPSRFKCPNCVFSTLNVGQYERHLLNDMHQRAKKQRWKYCSQCKYKTLMQKKLDIHLLKHKRFKCAQCDFFTFSSNDLQRHIKTEHMKMLILHRCELCTYKTDKRNRFEAHLRRHVTNEKKGALYCILCDFQSKFKDRILTHIRKAHLEYQERLQNINFDGRIKILFRSKSNVIDKEKANNSNKKNNDCKEINEKNIEPINNTKSDKDNNIIVIDDDMIAIDFVEEIDDIVVIDEEEEEIDDIVAIDEEDNEEEKEMELEKYNCVYCAFSTKTQHNLNEHIQIMHNIISEM